MSFLARSFESIEVGTAAASGWVGRSGRPILE